jgi:hypothetical protein
MGWKDQQSDPRNVIGTRKLLVADIECIHHAAVQPWALLAVGRDEESIVWYEGAGVESVTALRG